MKPISELTEDQIEILASKYTEQEYALNKLDYTKFLNKRVKTGVMPIHVLPYFIVQVLIEWGYYETSKI